VTTSCEISFWARSCSALSFLLLLLQETEDANDLRIRGSVAPVQESGETGNRKPGNQETQWSMLTPVVN